MQEIELYRMTPYERQRVERSRGIEPESVEIEDLTKGMTKEQAEKIWLTRFIPT